MIDSHGMECNKSRDGLRYAKGCVWILCICHTISCQRRTSVGIGIHGGPIWWILGHWASPETKRNCPVDSCYIPKHPCFAHTTGGRITNRYLASTQQSLNAFSINDKGKAQTDHSERRFRRMDRNPSVPSWMLLVKEPQSFFCPGCLFCFFKL